jgi:hypothetical protein
VAIIRCAVRHRPVRSRNVDEQDDWNRECHFMARRQVARCGEGALLAVVWVIKEKRGRVRGTAFIYLLL